MACLEAVFREVKDHPVGREDRRAYSRMRSPEAAEGVVRRRSWTVEAISSQERRQKMLLL